MMKNDNKLFKFSDYYNEFKTYIQIYKGWRWKWEKYLRKASNTNKYKNNISEEMIELYRISRVKNVSYIGLIEVFVGLIIFLLLLLVIFLIMMIILMLVILLKMLFFMFILMNMWVLMTLIKLLHRGQYFHLPLCIQPSLHYRP